ncbi:hypothetical protein NF552_23185 (plasmid) [Roseomonas mucosa]|nr:hypothetical protein NF552_23185 [Roseomonas mucosa]
MSDTTVAAERPKGPAENPGRDPLRDVLDRMNRAREHVAAVDPHLSDTIRLLTERAEQPGRTESTNFRIRVAYALQDLEKLAGPVANMSEPMRQEMARLATTMPGLQNERLQELMRRTQEIQDVGLIRDIRVVAADAATRPAQDTASIRDRVDALESRARLSGIPGLPLASTAHAEAENARRTPEAVNDPANTGTPALITEVQSEAWALDPSLTRRPPVPSQCGPPVLIGVPRLNKQLVSQSRIKTGPVFKPSYAPLAWWHQSWPRCTSRTSSEQRRSIQPQRRWLSGSTASSSGCRKVGRKTASAVPSSPAARRWKRCRPSPTGRGRAS